MNTTAAALLSAIDARIAAHDTGNICPTCQLDPEDCRTLMALYGKRANAHDRTTVTTAKNLHTPTSGIIYAGSEVTIIERIPGAFILTDVDVAVRRSHLLTPAQVLEHVEL